MTDRLTLTGLRGFGRHGVLPHEREHAQPFVVDVVLHLDTARSATSGDLADTVHYGELAQRVVDQIEGEPVDLIETLAERIAADCLKHSVVRTVEVTVHKPRAPIPVPFDDVSVTIARSRA